MKKVQLFDVTFVKHQSINNLTEKQTRQMSWGTVEGSLLQLGLVTRWRINVKPVEQNDGDGENLEMNLVIM